MIEFSLNEVEQLAAKVARGAGYSWGLAEDVARAARVLAINGLPWDRGLVLLAEFRASATTTLVCPMLTAARVSDDPAVWGDGPRAIRDVAAPLWLAAGIAEAHATSARALRWDGAALIAAAGSLVPDRAETNWLASRSGVRISPAPWPRQTLPRARRARADERVLATLDRFAERVYVPASDASRARGAGGGRVDDE